MKIKIDLGLCEGNAKCQETAPLVFRVDDDAKSYLISAEPPDRMRPQVEAAVRRCPRGAIAIEEE